MEDLTNRDVKALSEKAEALKAFLAAIFLFFGVGGLTLSPQGDRNE